MGKLLKTYCVPHPPIVIPQIGQGSLTRCQKTHQALVAMAKDIYQLAPKRIVIISPHGTVFSDGMGILYTPTLQGDFHGFGYPEIGLSFKNDMGFIDSLIVQAGKSNIVLAKIDEAFAEDMQIPYQLDHGALVPLWFIKEQNIVVDLVHITYGLLSPAVLYQFGQILRQVIKSSNGDTVLLASGDMSHALMDSGPYQFDPNGINFDEMVVSSFKNSDPYEFLTYPAKKREASKECGYRSLCIAWGAYDRLMVTTEVLSYEGPFGVGYLVASIKEADGIRPSLVQPLKEHFTKIHSSRLASEDDYVKLARHVVNTFVLQGEVPEVDRTLYAINEHPHGCFVSIKTEEGLRGCIGTIFPTRTSLIDEIVENAVKACSEDPRFDPITEEELADLVISVDVLLPPEPIADTGFLDVKRYGVIVSAGFKKGLLLPNLEGVDTVEDQVRIAKSKADIHDEPYLLERFEVIRHEGKTFEESL